MSHTENRPLYGLHHKVGETPDNISWDLDGYIGYYDSDIIYIAISD